MRVWGLNRHDERVREARRSRGTAEADAPKGVGAPTIGARGAFVANMAQPAERLRVHDCC